MIRRPVHERPHVEERRICFTNYRCVDTKWGNHILFLYPECLKEKDGIILMMESIFDVSFLLDF